MADDHKDEVAFPSQVESPPYSIFSPRYKAFIVTMVSVAATFSGISSNIYHPAIPSVAADLGTTPEMVNLTVTAYLIFQGLSPSIWGAIADVHGRRVTYIFTFIVFFGACVGLAETRAFAQLVVLRCVQSTGSASTIAIGAGVIGDITTREERGGYMGIYQSGLLTPVAVGPILGGVFSQTLGWRAIFWFLAIYSGVYLVVMIVVLPETLRSLVGNGSIPTKGLATSVQSWVQRRRSHKRDLETSEAHEMYPIPQEANQKPPINFLGSIQILIGLEVTCIIIFAAFYYTVWQMIITVMSTLFKKTYGLSDLHIGLTYLGNGFGCIIGTLTTGKILDRDYLHFKNTHTGRSENFPLEQARLRTVWLWSALQCTTVLVFGWTIQYKIHISVPIICTFIMGWSSTSMISVVSTLVVDIFPKEAASATAAINLLRCLMGAGGVAAVLPLVNAIGAGWTFTVLTGMSIAGLGLVVLQMGYGRKRRLSREQAQRDAAEP